ncbi:MAG: glucosamine inositolphosphorylceramide transferase family protein [Terriglobales bacterium]
MATRWRVGVVEAPITAFLKPEFNPEVRWIPLPRGQSWARPFGRVGQGGLEVFCEAGNHLARIRDGVVEPLLGFPAEADLSHPYLVEEDSDVYCVPGVADASEVCLYQRLPSGEWAYSATLLPNFAGLEAVLFAIEGRWWMTCPRVGDGGELCLFHAPTLRGPWQAHAGNPFRTAAAKPAGTPFLHDGVLYRPAVDREGVVIQRVRRLTPASFEEEMAVRVPGAWRTLAAVGAITLVDAPAARFLRRQ